MRHFDTSKSEYHFLKNDKNGSQLSRNHLYVSCDALNYTKSFLGLQGVFFNIDNVLGKFSEKILQAKK